MTLNFSNLPKKCVFVLSGLFLVCCSGNLVGVTNTTLGTRVLLEFKRNELASPYCKKSIPEDRQLKVKVKSGVARFCRI